MAEFKISGMDEAIRALEKANLFDEETATEMLGGIADEFLVQLGRKASTCRYHVADLISHVTVDKKAKKNKQGYWTINAKVAGKNSRGVSRGVILFVLNYGRKARNGRGKIEGAYFWTDAKNEAQRQAEAIASKIAEKKLRERGLL